MFQVYAAGTWLLTCPICGFDYVHPGTVSVDGSDKDRDGTPTRAESTVRITCECEEEHTFVLVLQFHEGRVYINAEPVT